MMRYPYYGRRSTNIDLAKRFIAGRSMPTRIEYLNATPGSQLTVLVTQVTSPSSFSAQPYGPELIQLMEEMG